MITSTDIIKAEKNNVNQYTLRSRLANGWSKEDAINKPVNHERAKWLKIARKRGISESTFDARVYQLNWSYEKAATKAIKKQERANEIDITNLEIEWY